MYNVFIGQLMLPVAPAAIEISIKNQNTTINLINDGEVNIMNVPGLTEISFEFLLPHTKYPFAQYGGGFVNQSAILAYLERLKTGQNTFQFIVSRMKGKKLLFSTNIKCTLENYAIKEDATNGFDQYVSVSLKQYRGYSTKVLSEDKNGKVTVKKERGVFDVLPISY